jgi:uncharacterized membrane protein YbhN (UPF0104 family)
VGDVPSQIAGWLSELREILPSIEPRYLAIALMLQSAQTLLNALAWRNVLAARYDVSGVRGRQVMAAFCGGEGLNAFLPVQAGTIAYLGMSRALIPGSRVATIAAASVVQNLFFVVFGIGVGAYLFAGQPQAVDGTRDLLAQGHPVLVLALVLLLVVAALATRLAWHHLRRFIRQVREGATILGHPHAYVAGVLAPQLASYALRIGVNMTFMAALGLPVTVRAAFLLAAANSISSLLAITPGGVGTQQMLAIVVLRGVAPAGAVAAYSLTQQAVVTAWNIVFGLGVMAAVFGWSATTTLLRNHRHGGDAPPPPPPPALAQ